MADEKKVDTADVTAEVAPAPVPSAPSAPSARKPISPKSILITIVTSLTFWMLVGLGVGLLLGAYAPSFSTQAKPVANLFLRPIQFVVFPLVFSSLVAAIAGHGDLKSLGRLGIKSFIYFEAVTTIALFLGLGMVNAVKPGAGISTKKYTGDSSTFTFDNWITHLTPKTWGEMMTGELLQTFVASVIFGCAAAMSADKYRKLVVEIADAVMNIMFNFVNIVIWAAPIGVCFSVAASVGSNGGLGVIGSLGKLVATVYAALIIFIIVVFGSVMAIARVNPFEFIPAIKEPLLIAYTTATSEAALPRAIECLEKYGCSPRVTVFTLSFGYAFNLDGSTLYLALASVFCAQATNIDKTIGEQIVMVLLLMITSKGVAGVRSASIIVLIAMLSTFQIPQDPVNLILGVDWFMDMARTFTNVLGNCLATVVMAKWEKEFRTEPLPVTLEEVEVDVEKAA